jgi:UDP-glucuronate 4-epimerase
LTQRKVLVTGAAGFIGMHVAQRLLSRGDRVIGVDSMNDYYDVALKRARLELLAKSPAFAFLKLDVSHSQALSALFERDAPTHVVHLAAQAGVRYSIQDPDAYVQSNLVGFGNILQECRQAGVAHLVYASSSSVYGGNAKLPWSEADGVDHPVNLYAATKRANELMAHAYSHLFRLPTTGLRFFTVYGPWGRPDMALFLFTKAMLEGKPIDVFNHGRMQRDFTYIDDVVEAVVRILDKPATPRPGYDAQRPTPEASDAPFRILNIGNHNPVNLLAYIEALEKALGIKAQKNLLPMQSGDVPASCADVAALQAEFGWRPATPVDVGIRRFVDWYRAYYPMPQRA